MHKSGQLEFRNERPGCLLHELLSQRMDLSGRQARRLLDERRVFVNGRRVWMARHALRAGDLIEVHPPASPPPLPERIAILYEDAACLVADKPAGLPSNGAGSVEEHLQQVRREPGLRAVHRLDSDTTGCLLFSRQEAAHQFLIGEFKAKRIEKIYSALVQGAPEKPSGDIRAPLEGRPALTRYLVKAAGPLASYLHLQIETGRTHQIRKHLALLGHPVLGDKEHGAMRLPNPVLRGVPRQLLHALRLAFTSPATHTAVVVSAPEPADLKEYKKKLLPRG